MTRPSHFVLLFLALAGIWLWISGTLEERLATTPPRDVRTSSAGAVTDDTPKVVRMPRPDTDVATTDAAVLRGRVVDHFGWPVADAEVRELGAPLRVRTDPAGWFDLPGDGATTRTLVVQAKSFRTETVRHAPTPSPATPSPLVVTVRDLPPWEADAPVDAAPQPSPRVGEGHARVANGEPAPFAVVTVRETGIAVRADGLGRFRVPLPTTSATLIARDAEGRAGVAEVDDGSAGLVPLADVRLTPSPRVVGRVKDDAGNPRAAVAVILQGCGLVLRASTDLSGAFTFRALIAGSYHLRVLPHDGLLGLRRELAVTSDVDLELDLAPDVPLTVRVVDTESRPVPHVHVVAAAEHDDARSRGNTNDAGEVTLRGLREGPFAFEVRRSDAFEPVAVVAFDGDAQTLTVRP
jgi:hypothetical protein